MAELTLTLRPSPTWGLPTWEAVTASGKVLAIGCDIQNQIALRVREEFSDSAVVTYAALPPDRGPPGKPGKPHPKHRVETA